MNLGKQTSLPFYLIYINPEELPIPIRIPERPLEPFQIYENF